MPQAKLSVIEVTAVIMCLIDGLTDFEVIEFTGVARGTVKRYRLVIERARGELVEQLTWAQLGRHRKPIILANIDGFWTPFLDLLAHMKADTFIRAGFDVRFTVVDRADQILPAAEAAASPSDAVPTGVSIAVF